MNALEPDGSAAEQRPYVLTRVTDDANLVESLQRVASAGCDLVANCAASSVTIITAGRPVTMAATDDVAASLDQAQYDADDGPCLTSARTEDIVSIDDLAADDRWPPFRDAGRELGIASSMSVPLLISDDDTLGALNVYGKAAGGFTTADLAAVRDFATHAAVVVSNVIAYWEALALSRNLNAAMEHRGVIEQAKGILMGAHAISPDDAFNLLRERSQRENRKLRDIAIDVVAGTQHTGGA
jgi:GAF domain-containing protein